MPSSSPAPPRKRGRWRVLVPILQVAVSAGLLTWLLANPATRAQLATLLHAADPRWLGAAVLVSGATIAVSIARWHCVLRALGIHLSPPRVGAIWLIGFFFDLFILGATGGDVMKALLVMREEPHRKITAALSIILDHLTGIFALAATATFFTLSRAGALLAIPAAATVLWFLVAYLALCLAAVPLVIAVGFLPPPDWIRRRPFFQRHGNEIHDSFRTMLRGWRGMLAAVGLSFVAWTGQFAVFWCAARAIAAPIKLADLLAATPVSETLVTLPVSVAGLGVREQSFQLLLGALGGVPIASAILISLGAFAAALVWNLAGGVIFAFYRPRRLD